MMKLIIYLVIALIVLGIVFAFFKFLLKWAIIAIVVVGLIQLIAPYFNKKS